MNSISPRTRPGSRASGRSRTAGTVSSTSKNSCRRGASISRWLTKLTTASSLPISSVAKLMNMTISPTVVRPGRYMKMPTTRIDRMVSVVQARVATEASAHQDKTGICAPSALAATLRIMFTSTSMRAKLWTSAMLPSVSLVRSATSL